MAWKKDLALIKQTLKPEETPPPKVAPPKPKPTEPRDLDSEDAVFLSAMGKAPRQASTASTESPRIEAEESFEAAMSGLRGLRPVDTPLVETPRLVEVPPVLSAPAPSPIPIPPPLPVPPPAETAPDLAPRQIQLAAGMALEVDAVLDLRGYAVGDARERLKERVMDGQLLGWKTLHLTLGADQELQQAFRDFLASPELRCISRYAQAPIPMGGAQAWILYYR